jgi:hypothetical protein
MKMLVISNGFDDHELRTIRDALEFYKKHSKLKDYFSFTSQQEIIDRIDKVLGDKKYDFNLKFEYGGSQSESS